MSNQTFDQGRREDCQPRRAGRGKYIKDGRMPRPRESLGSGCNGSEPRVGWGGGEGKPGARRVWLNESHTEDPQPDQTSAGRSRDFG